MHRFFPHTDEDIKQMLDVIGVKDLKGLYAEIPEQLKLKKELNLPEGMSEIEIRQRFHELTDKNKELVCFAGAGAYDHYTPSVIPYIASRSEFCTSYTPYQAEISQGTLQYIFEYQTMMAELTGMDLSNASMYDGTTVAAEAAAMCVAAAKKRNTVLVSETVPAYIREVMHTYAKYQDIRLEVIADQNGQTDRDALKNRLSQNDIAGVVVAQPNRYGIVEDFTGLADECHATKALLVINGPASPLGSLRTPGEWGADIACGEAQSLGIPLNYGGPYIGYLCTTNALIRKLPGRIVGETTDANGQRAFVLTMQAREQHIRREKATSNICTSQGLMCLYVTIYLSLMGKQGLSEVNTQSYAKAHLLHDELLKTGKFAKAFDAPFFNEFCLSYNGNVDELLNKCAEKGYLAGVKIDDHKILFAVTEKRTEEEIYKLIDLVK
ncbi:MAG: aminomethyl-transferring glycine dehydrogenase subunit GcvPA [Phocaeicola sp.]|nr:aminomethyl-transferring glycine dehydrogenase subunit GcvPA [Phocaeicola sp.]MDD7448726.1 aminomethyl-transferring glycine dehydrogenase subunit GcvPA [Prevotellaceae bacterium]MDY3914235.1 aminomethyl-transferring glycine dehydrogenase subunit GcvPA [Phocaeicola sp.]MDY5938229.1 aminomethyl-transferring glycine dehydrogenase subunit GcvPA [Phocaeicola sp.]